MAATLLASAHQLPITTNLRFQGVVLTCRFPTFSIMAATTPQPTGTDKASQEFLDSHQYKKEGITA